MIDIPLSYFMYTEDIILKYHKIMYFAYLHIFISKSSNLFLYTLISPSILFALLVTASSLALSVALYYFVFTKIARKRRNLIISRFVRILLIKCEYHSIDQSGQRNLYSSCPDWSTKCYSWVGFSNAPLC